MYIFHFIYGAKICSIGWFGKKSDDLLRKNAIIVQDLSNWGTVDKQYIHGALSWADDGYISAFSDLKMPSDFDLVMVLGSRLVKSTFQH